MLEWMKTSRIKKQQPNKPDQDMQTHRVRSATGVFVHPTSVQSPSEGTWSRCISPQHSPLQIHRRTQSLSCLSLSISSSRYKVPENLNISQVSHRVHFKQWKKIAIFYFVITFTRIGLPISHVPNSWKNRFSLTFLFIIISFFMYFIHRFSGIFYLAKIKLPKEFQLSRCCHMYLSLQFKIIQFHHQLFSCS